jgi:polar amino acid transport system permease protein
MIFQQLEDIASFIGNNKWIFTSIIIFIIGIIFIRWYAKKKAEPYEKIWDTSFKAAVIVNLILLIINISANILLNSFLATDIFSIIIRNFYIYMIINLFVGVIVISKVYRKKLGESFDFAFLIQLSLFIIVLVIGFVIDLILIPPYVFIFILVNGLPQTLVVTAIGLSWGFLIGIILAIMRVYGGIELGWLASGYEKIFRGIPLLVLIYLFTFGVPFLSALEGVVLALALRSGAYQSQIFRGAFLSVNPGQMDAAYTIGMNRMQAFRFVLMPQALRIALPSWSNEYSVVIKDSSFAFEVGIIEMTRAAYYVSVSFRELWALSMGVVALTYFIFTYPVTKYFGERQTNKLKKLGMGGG